MLDSDRTLKIKVRSCRTVFKILLMSVVICSQRILHGKVIAQYFQNYKRHVYYATSVFFDFLFMLVLTRIFSKTLWKNSFFDTNFQNSFQEVVYSTEH